MALVLVRRPPKQIRWQLVDTEFWRRNDHSDRQELMAIKVIIGDWSYDGSKQKSIEWASGALRSHRSVAVRTGLDAPLLVGMGVPFGVLWRGTRYYRLPHEKGSGASRATDLRRSDSGEGEEIIQSITSLGFVAMLVVPALDHRFGWSALPLWSTLAGDTLVAISFLIIFFFRVQREYFYLGDDPGLSRATGDIDWTIRACASSDVHGWPFSVCWHVSLARVVVGLLRISPDGPRAYLENLR